MESSEPGVGGSGGGGLHRTSAGAPLPDVLVDLKDQQHCELLTTGTVSLFKKTYNGSFMHNGVALLPDLIRFGSTYGSRTTVFGSLKDTCKARVKMAGVFSTSGMAPDTFVHPLSIRQVEASTAPSLPCAWPKAPPG